MRVTGPAPSGSRTTRSASEDGMQAGGEALLAELQRAAQVGCVGQAQGRAVQTGGPLHQFGGGRRPRAEGVPGMGAQLHVVGVGGHVSSPAGTSPRCPGRGTPSVQAGTPAAVQCQPPVGAAPVRRCPHPWQHDDTALGILDGVSGYGRIEGLGPVQRNRPRADHSDRPARNAI